MFTTIETTVAEIGPKMPALDARSGGRFDCSTALLGLTAMTTLFQLAVLLAITSNVISTSTSVLTVSASDLRPP